MCIYKRRDLELGGGRCDGIINISCTFDIAEFRLVDLGYLQGP